nr:hypothetical protein [Chloroflexus sp.]
MIWFGSWVNDLPSPGSDVDLCLIVSTADKPPRERVADFYRLDFRSALICSFTLVKNARGCRKYTLAGMRALLPVASCEDCR